MAKISWKGIVAGATLLVLCILLAAVNKTANCQQWRTKSALSRLQSERQLKRNGQRQRKRNKNRRKYGGSNISSSRGRNRGNVGSSNGDGNSGSSGNSNSGTGNAAESIDHNKWKVRGAERSGLEVQVLNNLDPDSVWNSYVKTSTREWDRSAALSLSLQAVDYNPECRAVPWAIKVCNEDFGKTGWKGVNQCLLSGKEIVASLAKYNDYYLDSMDSEDRLYTVCHELGHAFGLAHSDEKFKNSDLGDCMDYTHNHENNMHPGRSNFKALKKLYGSVNRGNRRLRVEKMDTPNTRLVNENREEIFLQEELDKYAAYLLDPIETSTVRASQDPDSKRGWRLLSKTDTAEIHERQLGNGYSLRTSILLP